MYPFFIWFILERLGRNTEIFSGFLVQMKTSKSHSKIIWPLEAAQPKHLWNKVSGFAPLETSLTHCISSKGFDNNIFYLLLFRRESGLESFVPTSLAESMKRKELKKLLGHFLKLNSSLTAPGNYFNSVLLDWIILGNS